MTLSEISIYLFKAQRKVLTQEYLETLGIFFCTKNQRIIDLY